MWYNREYKVEIIDEKEVVTEELLYFHKTSWVKVRTNLGLIVLDDSNTEMEVGGWFWSEEEPADYLEWKNSRDLEEEEVDNE